MFLKTPYIKRYLAVFFLAVIHFCPDECYGQFQVMSVDTHSILLYFTDDAYKVEDLSTDLGYIENFTKNDSTFVRITGIPSATLFQLTLQKNTGTRLENVKVPFITKSKSSGEIKIFFNLPVDPTFRKDGFNPDGTSFSQVQIALRDAIRNAKTSIDLAAYNTNEIFLVNELIDARNRGVRVRVIADDETTNSGWSGGVPFPVVYGNIGSGLMHNKFLVIDPFEVDQSLVITGSMNFTFNQMRRDPNHLIFIQDQSLATAYTIEFEEMWGGDGNQPNPQNAKFGAQKKKNTPTHFNINGVKMELYFSPSDSTTHYIGRAIENTQNQLLLALMIFTNWELRDVVKEVVRKGIASRWIVDDASSSSSVMNTLRQAGMQIFVHEHSDIFHHKYAIIDENGTNPVVITGSHNWTFSAETANDENTLIIYDRKIANIFRQEYEARWREFMVGTSNMNSEHVDFYPNPTIDGIFIPYAKKTPRIFDVYGNEYYVEKNTDNYFRWSGAPGLYFISCENTISKVIRL